jgi:hypothetical protein
MICCCSPTCYARGAARCMTHQIIGVSVRWAPGGPPPSI